MISIVGDAVNEALEKLDEFGVRGTISLDTRLACAPEGQTVEKGRICGQNPPAGQRTFGLIVRFALGSK